MSTSADLTAAVNGELRQRGWGVDRLSAASGVSERVLAGRLTGRTAWTVQDAWIVARALDLWPSDLIRRGEAITTR